MEAKLKRYVVAIDFYLFAESDDEAILIAKKIAKKQDEKHDDKCSVRDVFENEFASMNLRKVY